jgi:Fuc2NAc and GlcNAc transferase
VDDRRLPDLAWLIIALTLPFSLWFTRAVRNWARRRDVVDYPGGRRAHAVATPRGGGLAIVVTVLAGVAMGGALGWIRPSLTAALIIGGAAIAIVSWLDDLYRLPISVRLLVHTLAAGGALACLGGVGHISVGPSIHQLGLAGNLVVMAGMVWLTNLYNFMDGADGFAALEAVMVALGGAILMPVNGEALYLALLLAAAVLGFFYWNRPPASVFMGDVGSCFIGFYFGVLVIDAKTSAGMPMTVWVIMLGAFVTDATLTITWRMLSGRRWTERHQTHAYQRLLRIGWTERRLLGALALLNLALVGLAWVVSRVPTTLAQLLLIGPAMIGLYMLVGAIAPVSALDEGPVTEESSRRPGSSPR